MAPSSRSPTGSPYTFKLSHPHPVIYDFTNLSSGLKIIVPPYSSWICHDHWHETASACETLMPLEGHFMIVHSIVTTRGSGVVQGDGSSPAKFVMPLEPEHLVRWQKDPHWDSAGGTMGFLLEASDEVYKFYRQVCSVNQDAEVYFYLPSTPLWLRVLYGFWGRVPHLGIRVRAWLVEYLLWIQLRVIYSKNDYLENEGAIPYTWPWRQRPADVYPPKKWMERELRSRITVSRLVLRTCAWVGTRILGMKARYDEYDTNTEANMLVGIRKELL
jgi:hypothetical protein